MHKSKIENKIAVSNTENDQSSFFNLAHSFFVLFLTK